MTLVTVEHLIQPWKVDTHNCILLFCSIQLQFILFTSLLFKSSKIGEARLVSGDAGEHLSKRPSLHRLIHFYKRWTILCIAFDKNMKLVKLNKVHKV